MKTVKITTEYITLGQLLKMLDIVYTGGETKMYLAEHEVLVNKEAENRRGRKLYPEDVVETEEITVKIAA